MGICFYFIDYDVLTAKVSKYQGSLIDKTKSKLSKRVTILPKTLFNLEHDYYGTITFESLEFCSP